jgi:replicative DNA helicase
MSHEFERTPPHDLAAEQCALGGMLLSRDAIGDVMAVIKADDHYRPAHQIVHEAIVRLFEAGEPADPVSVAADLTRRGEIARIQGAPYLHTLIAAVPTAANAGYYARIVREKAILRHLIEAATRIVQIGYSEDGNADEIADRARKEIEDAAASVNPAALRSVREVYYGALRDVEDGTERGLPLPWADVTAVLNGLAPGQLVYIAARPGTGKSIAGAMIAADVAMRLKLPALLVSMEMRAEEIMLRLVSATARVPLQGLLSRQVTDSDWDAIARAKEPITESKLVIDDTSKVSVGHIRSRLREMARTEPAAVLVVDYLGLMETRAGAESRNQAVAELSRELKLMAGEFAMPVVVLAQLNRGPEHRPDKRPVLSDLRDSGAQEQDADVVILLHREDAYDPESPRAGEIDFIVAKNRTGPQATIVASFLGHYGCIRDMARAEWSPSAKAAS